MKIFICTDHDTFYPVGGASMVVAESEERAKELLSSALKAQGLPSEKFTLVEVEADKEAAHILNDGDY